MNKKRKTISRASSQQTPPESLRLSQRVKLFGCTTRRYRLTVIRCSVSGTCPAETRVRHNNFPQGITPPDQLFSETHATPVAVLREFDVLSFRVRDARGFSVTDVESPQRAFFDGRVCLKKVKKMPYTKRWPSAGLALLAVDPGNKSRPLWNRKARGRRWTCRLMKHTRSSSATPDQSSRLCGGRHEVGISRVRTHLRRHTVCRTRHS